MLGDDELDDCIAQEFKTLVVEGIVLSFERNAGMRHRLSEKKTVAKLVPKRPSIGFMIEAAWRLGSLWFIGYRMGLSLIQDHFKAAP